jgi:hypothetical protein
MGRVRKLHCDISRRMLNKRLGHTIRSFLLEWAEINFGACMPRARYVDL